MSGDSLRPTEHFLSGATRERQEQDALGRHAFEQQVRDSMRQRVGLARARAGDDQQRTRREAVIRMRSIQGGRTLSVVQGLTKNSAPSERVRSGAVVG